MNKIKFIAFIAGLQLATVALTAIFMARQERDNKEQGELLYLGNEIIKRSNKGIDVVGNWRRDGKITNEMATEFVDTLMPDKDTVERIINL